MTARRKPMVVTTASVIFAAPAVVVRLETTVCRYGLAVFHSFTGPLSAMDCATRAQPVDAVSEPVLVAVASTLPDASTTLVTSV